MAYHDTLIASASRPAAKADSVAEPYYRDGSKRVMRDGVPMRVFQWRTRELAAQIAAIELAAQAGCKLELEGAPRFDFSPVERQNALPTRRPTVTIPRPCKALYEAYYGKGVRATVGGIPCRFARPLAPNHSTRHWPDLSQPMGGIDAWQKRAERWWNEQRQDGDLPVARELESTGEAL